MYFLLPILPVLPVLLIHILAATLPAAYLLRYVCRHDTIEPEPPGLLFLLLVAGVLAALCSGILEGFGERILDMFMLERTIHTVLFAFLVVAAVEEGTKFLFLRRLTWNHPAFNYRFDGIVYAVFVSLGFAAFENIQYVLGYGLQIAIPRAILSIPGHMAFSIFMGVFYGRAKLCENWGYYAASRLFLLAGYLIAVLLHGVYDACAMNGTINATVAFVIFVSVTFIAAYYTLKHESATDMPV